MSKPKYDSTVARIAGNIASGLCRMHVGTSINAPQIAEDSVRLARFIVAETKRTEPVEDPQP